MRNFLRLFTLTIMLATCINSYSQMGITSYSINALAINTSQNKKISGELKLFANRNLDEVMTEVNVFYNFKARPYHRFSVGLGLNVVPLKEVDPIHAITLPAAIEIYPLQDFKRLSLLFELTTEFTEDIFIRTMWGVRYSFND